MNEQEQRVWHLLAQKFSGESTPEEMRELADSAQQDPILDHLIKTLEFVWNKDIPEEIACPDPVKMWNRLTKEGCFHCR